MMPRMPALVVLNARSGTGSGDAQVATLRELFAQEGVEAEFVLAHGAGDMFEAVDRACARGVELVVAGGGDGTQSAVASRLAGRDMVQGVLPLGTLNHFAKDLGIPLQLPEAVRTLARGRVLEVDVGEVNGRVFINNSSLGLYPRIVRQREAHRKKGLPKWIAMLRALLYVACHHSSLYLRLKIDDAGSEFRKTPFIFIGNNRYELAGLNIGKRNSLRGAHLWICRAPDANRGGLLRLTLRALSGRLKDKDLEATEAKEAWIETHSRHAHVSTDGEVLAMKGPLHYRSRPRALKVIVPQRTATQA